MKNFELLIDIRNFQLHNVFTLGSKFNLSVTGGLWLPLKLWSIATTARNNNEIKTQTTSKIMSVDSLLTKWDHADKFEIHILVSHCNLVDEERKQEDMMVVVAIVCPRMDTNDT